MARADLLLRGGQSTKNASDTAAGAGGRSTAPAGVAHTGQGGLRGRETALPPAGGGVAPALGQHHPRGTRSCDKRRPEHSVGGAAALVGGRGHSPRLAEPPPRRIEATRGQGRCPKVSGGRRAAAGRPPSLRTRPCLARRATAGSPPVATWSARVPHQQLLQQPTCRVGSQHAARAAAPRRDRHAAPARDVGRRVTRQGAAVTQPRPGAGRAGPARASGRDRAARAPIARSIEVFSAGWRAARRGYSLAVPTSAP